MGVRADSQDDKRVSKNSDHVYGQEQSEEDKLEFRIFCHFQEKEIWNICLISWFLVMKKSDGKYQVEKQ